MVPKLYYSNRSPCCRVVLLAAKVLSVELKLQLLDLMKGEHMTPDFLKLNPEHTVPVLDDSGLILTESRAIITYLADKYGKDDALYPKDVKKRALVNQKLYFDATTLYQRFMDYYFPYFFYGAPLVEDKKKRLDDAMGYLNGFLSNTKCIAGDHYTLADLASLVTVNNAAAVGYDVSKYPKITEWLATAKTSLPGFEVEVKGAANFKEMIDILSKK